MITMAVIPVIGVLALFLLMILVTSRRSGAIAALRQDVEDSQKQIRQREQELIQSTLQELVAGKRPDETLKGFMTSRAQLLDGKPGWDDDDLKQLRRRLLREGSEAVNRRMLVPAVGGAVMVVATCVVVMAVLYHFEAGNQAELPGFGATEAAMETATFDSLEAELPPVTLEAVNQDQEERSGT